jgi:hypothetical protein
MEQGWIFERYINGKGDVPENVEKEILNGHHDGKDGEFNWKSAPH